MTPVDAFDLKILGALQDDGRLTNQQLADRRRPLGLAVLPAADAA